MIRKIAILTSGGDAPGMNAAIRCCVRAGLYYGKQMFVVYDGYKGLVEGNIVQVNKEFTADIINRGGTIIRSARLPEFKEEAVLNQAIRNIKDFEIDAIVGIGGDGTFRGLLSLARAGIPVIGIPATIDNDVACTVRTIGFDTALNTICDCIDKIKDTSSSHQKCSIIEVMGRHCGDLAVFSSIAEGAELTVTFDHPYNPDFIFRRLRQLKAQKKSHAVVVVSENLMDIRQLAKDIEEQTGFDTSVEILGHIQRGGTPTATDRIYAARMATLAIQCLDKDITNRVIAETGQGIVDLDIEEALNQPRDIHEPFLEMINILQ